MSDSSEKLADEQSGGIDFIRRIIKDDLATGKNDGRVHTRFPPEPNGFLHIGHAKSICLNFGIANDFNGLCNLRFDDTNPIKEEERYVEAIKADVRWLGFDWEDRLFHASDFFEDMYGFAVELIKAGKAYVCQLSADEIRAHRGTLTTPGTNSPYRDRSVEENLDLFSRMRNGEFKDGELVLRAKIDMASPNMNLRDPTVYRVRHEHHQRTGDAWCIYPMYDFAHGLSDALEGITHSICTLEFEAHRPLYDWFIENVSIAHHPQQIEFARLNLSYTVLSKRRLISLVENKHVSGWDDPRMPTVAGLRRRGYTPEAIRDFCDRIGIAKADSTVDPALLDFCVREDLNKRAARVMGVLEPLKLVITNYPEGNGEQLEVDNNPEDPNAGKRSVPFSRELFIEREDFMETPAKKFFRLAPGKEVRLAHAYYVTCTEVVKDSVSGEVTEVHCTYDPATKGGWSEDGRKVKGTLHWVSAPHSIKAEVRLYDRLFTVENPNAVPEGKTFEDFINPEALIVLNGCRLEPGLEQAPAGTRFQFLRKGYFCVDSVDSSPDKPVFNRITGLRDSWARVQRNS